MKHVFFLFVTLLTFSASAQQLIKGSILDAEGEVPFVNIIIKHSTKGVLSDEKGNFEIEAKSTDTLQISSLGYATKELSVGDQKQLQVTLDEFEQLDEVLVIGYTPKYKTVTTVCCGKRLGCYTETVCCCEDNLLSRNDIAEQSKLYPNPSRDGIFNLKIPNDIPDVDVTVADLTGCVILKTTRTKLDCNMVLDLSQQPTGIYIVNLSSRGKQITSKKAIRI
ncbi:carboxypeptidase-like regulatory domain-containing protein [uncultured Psychroserpens sp.]|uniref:carboxypeptidase-like regulatory domain-containing protein n=1 Tax=uncultured Psychroserpens sp. TaxID=255436 RepID=UPI00260B5753|nr:carboxypeptidase-like regulatory domain-containing protein [uncultured Psychroserpens sp.]